jgi:hypothetical protein
MDDGIFWEFERWLGRFAYGAQITTDSYLFGLDMVWHGDVDAIMSAYIGFGPYMLFVKVYAKEIGDE